MQPFKLLLVAAAAAAMLASAVDTASARNLSFSSQHWRGTFAAWELISAFGTTRCAITLEGSLHSRTFSKTNGILVGYVTGAQIGACTFGTATLLTETLPWHVRYASFAGTLPNIRSLSYNVIGFAFRVRENGGITCLLRSNVAEPATFINTLDATATLTSRTLGGTIRSGAECFGVTGRNAGTSNSLTDETGGRITGTLI